MGVQEIAWGTSVQDRVLVNRNIDVMDLLTNIIIFFIYYSFFKGTGNTV